MRETATHPRGQGQHHHWVREGDPWDDVLDPEGPDTLRVLEGYVADAQTHQQRADTKASPLIAGLVALVATLLTGRPEAADTAAGMVGIAALAGVAMTVMLTLWAIRPSLSGNSGVVRWAKLPADLIAAEAAILTVDPGGAARHLADAVRVHARIAVRRYRRVRLSTDMALVTLLMAAIARVLTFTT